MTKTLFLPGAGGSASFWEPVASQLQVAGLFFAWPGLGDEPADPSIRGLDDLVSMVLAHMTEPVDIVAQSMGGLIAIKSALAAPKMVRRLVLSVTSAGVPVTDLGGTDWRPEYFQTYPHAASWVSERSEDLSEEIRTITAPTLLLWGDKDSISPVSVGQRLSALLPDARLCVIPGAGHDLARTHVTAVASAIDLHLLERA